MFYSNPEVLLFVGIVCLGWRVVAQFLDFFTFIILAILILLLTVFSLYTVLYSRI
jgi:hypothetical protein